MVVADHLHADAPLLEARVVERGDAEAAIQPREEDVGGAVVRLRGPGELEVARDAENAIARAGSKGIAHESAPLRPPCVFDARIQISRDELSDLVFESLLL